MLKSLNLNENSSRTLLYKVNSNLKAPVVRHFVSS